MKILVGIMYCIENEYEQCKESIKRQSHTNWELFTIENLSNKEAHDTLYRTFMNRADEFDLFMKVDADMVLCRNSFFEEVISAFQKDPEIDDLSIAVYDFFTKRLIHGLHVYDSNVKWKKSNERVFVDRLDNCRKRKVLWDGPLVPAAYHCPDPSLFQSFHFGLHKAVKVVQADRVQKRLSHAKDHFENVLLLIKIFLSSKDADKRIGIAAFAAISAIRLNLTYEIIDFDSIKSRQLYAKISSYSVKTIRRKVYVERLFLLPFLPKSKRLHFLLLLQNYKKRFRLAIYRRLGKLAAFVVCIV